VHLSSVVIGRTLSSSVKPGAACWLKVPKLGPTLYLIQVPVVDIRSFLGRKGGEGIERMLPVHAPCIVWTLFMCTLVALGGPSHLVDIRSYAEAFGEEGGEGI
jgi:hypothetical protein